jgi:chromosome segregation and condensation protein ScpB
MDKIKELIEKLKSQRSGKEIQYLYGHDKGAHIVREAVIEYLEKMLSDMESQELSDHLFETWNS